MDTQKLLEEVLSPPVLIALIYGVVALVCGHWLIRMKDEQIKTKDEQIATLKEAHSAHQRVKDERIAYLEQLMPVSMVEQIEAAKRLFKMQLETAQEMIDLLTNQNKSEQEKRGELEARYRHQIEVLTKRLKSAEEAQIKLLPTIAGGSIPWLLPNVTLHPNLDLQSVVTPTTPGITHSIIEDWSAWVNQYRTTSEVFHDETPNHDEDDT